MTAQRLECEFVDYDPKRHGAFVRSSWCRGAREPWETLNARLRRPETVCIVAHLPGKPDSLLGWAAYDWNSGAVIWVYVRSLFGKLRRRGLGRCLLIAAGTPGALGGDPIPCLYWSPYATAIAAGGAPIFYAPKGVKEAA